MKATHSPGETRGEFSGIAAKVAIGGGYLCRGREEMWAPITCLKAPITFGGRRGVGRGHLVYVPSWLLPTYTPCLHSFCICSRYARDYGDVPFGERQPVPSPAVLITDS